MYEIVCNGVKTIQVSWIRVAMYIQWSHAGLTCVECCKDIRVLLYSDGQRKRTAGTIASLRALRRRLVENIGGATSFIRIELERWYNSSFYRHPEWMCTKNWLRRGLPSFLRHQQQLNKIDASSHAFISVVYSPTKCIFYKFVPQTGVLRDTNSERVDAYPMSSGYLDGACNMVNRMLVV